jgi:hypothetical protein
MARASRESRVGRVKEASMSELVERLSSGTHPVEVSLRPEKSIQGLRECLDRGYVHVKFTGTRGGTELGVPIDRERTDLREADFEHQSGRLTIVGPLSLDFVEVRCIAEINLPSLSGVGRLERIGDSKTP